MAAVFGIMGINQIIPRIRSLVTSDIIYSVAGSNPVDISFVKLTNIRGQLSMSGVASDTGIVWAFQVQGGADGDYASDTSRNYYFITGTNTNCTVNTLYTNRLEILTPIADAGGRRYIIDFVPLASFGPSINQTSINVLGAANLTVTTTKILLVPSG